MRIGLTSPIVTQVPGVHSRWERDAGIEDLGVVAEAADRLGFDHLTCSEHVAVPTAIAEERGATYWDPLPTLGYLAARTTRIRLATQVLVLGYHHPLAVAKRYGTLDRVSAGRLVLGVGVGSLEEEFDLLGATFAGRGAIADEALVALRAAFGQREPEHHGEHFDFAGFVVEPHAVQERVPMWVGGRTPRSLRRALELGDGWVPFGLGPDALRQMLDKSRDTGDVPDDFEIVLSPGRSVDPTDDAESCTRALQRLRTAGATLVTISVRAQSASHYCEQLEALASLAGAVE